ncbi:MAG: hypothetical protein K0S76_2791 [Herbinix sp.]|nr:hypothetical protein [Herbinix sp.]
MSLSHIFSLIFFLSFTIYAFMGTYILSVSTKNILKHLFFLMCLSLGIWTFGDSISQTTLDYETAIFWRRFSSLGWGSLFSILMHFIIVLTENNKKMKQHWLYLLLYIPAVIHIFVFGINNDLALRQYNLVLTEYGWVNIPSNNWWAWQFHLHYILIIIIGIVLIWFWGKKSEVLEKKKQANLFIMSITIALLLGTMTDILINVCTPIFILELSPIIIILPMATICCAFKRYGRILSEIRPVVEPGKILNEIKLVKFYQVMSMGFIVGGIISFISQYFLYQAPIIPVLMFSAFLFLFGILLQIVRLLPISEGRKENFLIILIAVSIPFITLNFLDYASITVWAMPFSLIILSVVYNKRRMMLWISVSIFITQIYVWIAAPSVIVQVEASDHLARIGIFSITLSMAFYVNRVYVKRLEENEAQYKFQKMVSDISAEFIKLNEANKDEMINWMLKRCGEYFQVDRTFYMSLTDHYRYYEWFSDGSDPIIDYIPELTKESVPWWMEQISQNEVVHIPEVELLPLEADAEKALMKQYHIQSLLATSISIKDSMCGFLCFASVKENKQWQENHEALLKILANLLSDAISKIEAEKEIRYLAYYDALTGLPNPTLFRNRLEQAIHLAKRTETLIGVVFIDLDSFKSVNDTIGHLGGDEMIRLVAERLSECLRKQDTVSRFGGDEFLIQFTQIDNIDYIKKVTENIMKIFDQPLTVKDQEFFVTASAGIAVYPIDGEDTETLIKNADLAMYASKDNGKNQFTLCSSEMKEDVLRRMKLTNRLYRAQQREEFELYYQPQMNISTNEIMGFEALLRWKHPDYGIISPAMFIPLAEQTGLINTIGQWVLKTACQQNKKWQEMGLPPVHMAVNLSVEQFRNPNLTGMIANILAETGLESKYLELEITESTAVKETDYIIHVLHELKRLGVSIAIDDFGTEYSSFSRLKTLPVDRIKIDIQFIHGVSETGKDQAIAKTIIQMAKNLKLRVIAEGVETKAQYEFLKTHMCDEVQGFYFFKPMPAAEIEEILIKVNKTQMEH